MNSLRVVCLALASVSLVSAKAVIFWQDGFPTIDSQPVSRQALEDALASGAPVFADLSALRDPAVLQGSNLLVMPYGSAFPVAAWPAIISFIRSGGNLLVIGGEPFHIPVTEANGAYVRQEPEEAYARELGILHTYVAPQRETAAFSWRDGYGFLPAVKVEAQEFFVLEGSGLSGLGYMVARGGEKIAAPVVISQHIEAAAGAMLGARWAFLDFYADPGYWDSSEGISLMRTAADYVRQGATTFWVEMPYSTWMPQETPEVIVHVRNTLKQRLGVPQSGTVELQLLSGSTVLGRRALRCSGVPLDAAVDFGRTFPPGFYTMRGIYYDGGKPREFYRNGFWVEDRALLTSGPVLGAKSDFLTENGKPFFPFGTNYFTTEENGWDFSSPRNAAIWETDFADMERHNISFVRTGVWGSQIRFLEQPDGGVSERFLRNLEAYLLCARRHNIAVNFTFFAFEPQATLREREILPLTFLPGVNPYLDPVTIRAEQDYMLSIVNRFRDVPYLCWDLINEPSFSNPGRLWKGNTPNGDAVELHAWHAWLREKYGSLTHLARAWSTTTSELEDFNAIPLPSENDMSFDLEHGEPGQARALDYNLFAQYMFSGWVKSMVAAIRGTGSKQLIDVGQDEGGVENRLLNQFYGRAGLSFTTNHTYRQNDALLWDSIAAKVPGVPNIIGETGYQPVILPNGDWRYDELTGASLLERKWAYGFAGGASGALSWDWAREIYFGIERSDGSAKIWEAMIREMGAFAKTAQNYASALIQPEVAIVLPQSLQLTEFNHIALEAQQNSVRALYGYARSQAYAVGEYQIEQLGRPKLIILPSPWILTEEAWDGILRTVQNGAVLLLSGRFDQDSHFNPTGRANEIGIPYRPGLLETREGEIQWPGGRASLVYPGQGTNFLERAFLPGGGTFLEKPLGKGKILYVPLPLELNSKLETVGAIYRYALKVAGVRPVYSTGLNDPSILICPTRLPQATLYVITSESRESDVSFRDERSAKNFSAHLDSGRSALVLVGENGDVLASYNWESEHDPNAAAATRRFS